MITLLMQMLNHSEGYGIFGRVVIPFHPRCTTNSSSEGVMRVQLFRRLVVADVFFDLANNGFVVRVGKYEPSGNIANGAFQSVAAANHDLEKWLFDFLSEYEMTQATQIIAKLHGHRLVEIYIADVGTLQATLHFMYTFDYHSP